jgi:hypothetical protein
MRGRLLAVVLTLAGVLSMASPARAAIDRPVAIWLTIAGKLNCDQVNTTCDYFAGDLDNLKIETS